MSSDPMTAPDREREAREAVQDARVACEQSIGPEFTQEEYDKDVLAHERALDAYRDAIHASWRAAIEEMRKEVEGGTLMQRQRNASWNAALDTLATRLTPRPTENG